MGLEHVFASESFFYPQPTWAKNCGYLDDPASLCGAGEDSLDSGRCHKNCIHSEENLGFLSGRTPVTSFIDTPCRMYPETRWNSMKLGLEDGPVDPEQIVESRIGIELWFILRQEWIHLYNFGRLVNPNQSSANGFSFSCWWLWIFQREVSKVVEIGRIPHTPGRCEVVLERCLAQLGLARSVWDLHYIHMTHTYLSISIYAPGPATPPLPPPAWDGSHIEIFPFPPCGVVGVWYCPPPPLWCGGGVVWYVGYVWCVWSVWYGMFGKYGCMVGMVCMACMFAIVCMVGVAIMLHMYGICGMYDRYDRYGMHGIIGMYGRYGIC